MLNIADIAAQIKLLGLGRDPLILAVSKLQPNDKILALYQTGQRHFAENYVQEAKLKAASLPDDIVWHLIGPLQKNKAKYCPLIFTWLHSLNSIELALELNKHYLKAGKKLNCLIQVNLSAEESKSGITSFEQLSELVTATINCEALILKGLMTIPDPSFNEEQTAAIYCNIADYQSQINKTLPIDKQLVELSMGMSNDYLLAAKAGATILRIGTAIFGSRQ